MSGAKVAPTSKRQELFLKSSSYLNIFGGAASGGKASVDLLDS